VSDRTTIECTDATWNPNTGCDKVSPGCDNCYALVMARRLRAMGNPKYQCDGNPVSSGSGFGLSCHGDTLELPFSWKRPRRVFVNSMSDLFHPGVPDSFIKAVWESMAEAGWHTFQVLTKRPKRMAKLLSTAGFPTLPNVWLGTSIESEGFMFRARHLRETPAHVRFLALEPLLGPLPNLELEGIDWVVTGSESGLGARAMELDWVRGIRDECIRSGVAFFFKQSRSSDGRRIRVPILDGEVWTQYPTVHFQEENVSASGNRWSIP
jgi:protein gp37